MKVEVTIQHKQTATFDAGDLPINLLRELLVKNEGTFDGNWGLGDVAKNDKWEVESVVVEPAAGKS
jgi:hypothetical protein